MDQETKKDQCSLCKVAANNLSWCEGCKAWCCAQCDLDGHIQVVNREPAQSETDRTSIEGVGDDTKAVQ